MSVKRMLSLFSVIGLLCPVLIQLAQAPGLGGLIYLAVFLSLAGFVLLFCALNREQTPGNTTDRSETVPPKQVALIFCAVGLMVAFILYRALAHA